jgi:hypothetical protein
MARSPVALKAPEIAKETVPEVPWESFLQRFQKVWDSSEGQHLSAIGHTRSGKTTTLVQVLDVRRYVVVLLTKLRDPLFPKLKAYGYKEIRDVSEWPSKDWHPKIAIHLPSEGLGRKEGAQQAGKIRSVLHRVWQRGHMDLYIDEIAELSDLLGLGTELRTLWKEAGSSNVNLIAGTQRPSRVPLEMYSQPRFLFFWHSSNREELKRLADMNAGDPELARQIVAQLDRFEILVVDAWEGELVRTRPPEL